MYVPRPAVFWYSWFCKASSGPTDEYCQGRTDNKAPLVLRYTNHGRMCFLRFDRGIEPGMVAGVTDGLKLYPVGINAKGS